MENRGGICTFVDQFSTNINSTVHLQSVFDQPVLLISDFFGVFEAFTISRQYYESNSMTPILFLKLHFGFLLDVMVSAFER